MADQNELVFVVARGEGMTSSPRPRVGQPVVQDVAISFGELFEFDGLIDHLREVDHFVATNALLFKELARFVDAEGRDGEAVRHRGTFSLQALNSGEKGETRRDVVFDEKHTLTFDVATFNAALVAVGLGRLANEDARLVETIGERSGVRHASAFNTSHHIEFETVFNDLRGHRFEDVAPSFRASRQATVVDIDRRNKAGLQTHRAVGKEGHGTVVDEVFGEDVFSNLGLIHFL